MPSTHRRLHQCARLVRSCSARVPYSRRGAGADAANAVAAAEFDYRLESIAALGHELDRCCRTLRAIGCDLVAQVGSPFAWAGVASEAEACARQTAMADAAGAPVIMTGLAIVDGLRAIGAEKVAVNCTYYDAEWRDQFAAFLRLCGFATVRTW